MKRDYLVVRLSGEYSYETLRPRDLTATGEQAVRSNSALPETIGRCAGTQGYFTERMKIPSQREGGGADLKTSIRLRKTSLASS